jgi:hypothetical protein
MAPKNAFVGKPAGPVALDVAAAFWQSSFATRTAYAFFSMTTIALLIATLLGEFGRFKS